MRELAQLPLSEEPSFELNGDEDFLGTLFAENYSWPTTQF